MESLECPVCLEKYDLSLHLPRILPICGHTLCSQCIPKFLKNSKDFICPIGKEVQPGNYKTLDSFPPNYVLRDSLEKSLQLCQHHQKELEFVCVQDKVKICNRCALFGEHKNHEIKPLSDLEPQMKKKIQEMKRLLQESEEYYKKTDKVYEDQRKAALGTIESRFKELRVILDMKEAEFIYQIILFYDHERGKLNSEIGQHSFVRQMLAKKLSEYEQMMKSTNPLKLLEEDFSAVGNIIQEALCPDRVQKFDKLFNQFQHDTDLMLGTQVIALERLQLKYENEENLKLLTNETNLKLNEKLSSRQELIGYQPIQAKMVGQEQNDIIHTTEKGEKYLQISYPLNISSYEAFNILKGVAEKVTCLQFKIMKDIEKVPPIDTISIRSLRRLLPNLQEIIFLNENHKISDEALLNIFTSLFCQNDTLLRISFKGNMKGLFEQSMLYLAEKVLPSAQNLNSLQIWVRNAEVPHKVWTTLAESISQIAERLTCFHFHLPCQDLDANSYQKLFASMPNLQNFAFKPFSKAFNSKALEVFISKTLPSLKKLKTFQLLLNDSTVTDISVQKLLKFSPQAWFLTLYHFELDLKNTQLTDKSVQEFIQNCVPKFQTSQTFLILTNNTKISPSMNACLTQWQQHFALKCKK